MAKFAFITPTETAVISSQKRWFQSFLTQALVWDFFYILNFTRKTVIIEGNLLVHNYTY